MRQAIQGNSASSDGAGESESVSDESGAKDEPSRRIVDQRVRNRVIEYLELAASFEDQLEYQRRAPIAWVPFEMINQWADWAGDGPPTLENQDSAYTTGEVDAMRRFYDAWTAASEALPDDWPQLDEAHALPEWQVMATEAAATLEVFALRGRLPEDREVPQDQ